MPFSPSILATLLPASPASSSKFALLCAHFIPPATAAPRSSAACQQTAGASGDSPRAATSSNGRALSTVRRSSLTAAASWSATTSRSARAAPVAATDCRGCSRECLATVVDTSIGGVRVCANWSVWWLLCDFHEPLGARISPHVEVTLVAIGIVTRLFRHTYRQVLVFEIHDRSEIAAIRSQRDTGPRHPQRHQELKQEFIAEFQDTWTRSPGSV